MNKIHSFIIFGIYYENHILYYISDASHRNEIATIYAPCDDESNAL